MTIRERPGVAGRATITGIAAFLALGVVVQLALWSSTGQAADERAMQTAMAGREAHLRLLSILGRVPMWSVAALAVAAVAIALFRRHGRAVIAALVVIAGSNVTTQLLKHVVLDRPDLGNGVHNSLPSGHVTVVAAAVATLLIVIPPAVRVAIGGIGAFAIALTGLSTVIAGWHRPGDVVAALLVTLVWCAVGVLVHGGRRGRTPAVLPAVLIGGAAGLVAIVVIGVRPMDGLDGFIDASLVLGAVALASAVAVWMMAWICPDAD